MQFGTDIFVKLLVVGEVGYGSIGRGGTKLFTQPNGGGKGEVEKGKKYAGTKEPTHDLQMRKDKANEIVRSIGGRSLGPGQFRILEIHSQICFVDATTVDVYLYGTSAKLNRSN